MRVSPLSVRENGTVMTKAPLSGSSVPPSWSVSELAPLWLVNLIKERRMLLAAKSTGTKSTRTYRDVGRLCHMITVAFLCCMHWVHCVSCPELQ